MPEHETIHGAPVTEQQIAQWADEAQAGYDVEFLAKRRRGRPSRDEDASQVVTVRLTALELSSS